MSWRSLPCALKYDTAVAAAVWLGLCRRVQYLVCGVSFRFGTLAELVLQKDVFSGIWEVRGRIHVLIRIKTFLFMRQELFSSFPS